MKAILIGASGVIGRRVATELIQADGVDELVLTSRDASKAERLARLFGDRATVLALDVRDGEGTVRAVQGADVVVSAAGPAYLFEPSLVRTIVGAGTGFVSLCDDHWVTEEVLALDGRARDAGVTVVSGCGMSPGLTNLLFDLAASEVDSVEEVEIAVAASSADASGAATALHFLAMMSTEAPALSDHAKEVGRAGTGPKLVYFPDPVGWVETFRAGHPEVITLSRSHPDVGSLQFRIGLTERAAMDVARASAALGLIGSETARRRWLRISDPLRPFIEALPPKGAPWTSARVDVRGRESGRPKTVTLAVTDRIMNLAAVPLARAALEIGSKACKPGVQSPDEAFDARSFLTEVSKRGVRIARLDPMAL